MGMTLFENSTMAISTGSNISDGVSVSIGAPRLI
jgi:hypothetical protein